MVKAGFNPDLSLVVCDIILTQSRKWLGRDIRFFEGTPGKPKPRVTHAAIVVDATNYTIEEALAKVKLRSLWKSYGNSAKKVVIYRQKLSDAEKETILKKVQTYVGASYGYSKILAHVGDWLLSMIWGRSVYFFRRFARMQKYPICSWVDAYGYAAIGVEFGVPPWAAEPDDIDDYCRLHPKQFECVYPLSELRRGD